MLIFLTDRKLLGLELTRILSDAGLPVLMEHPEAAEYLCRERTVGALLIDGVPNASAARALCNRLRAEYTDLPIMLILAQNASADTVADRIIRVSPLREMANEILTLCADCGWRPRLSTYTLLVTDVPADTRLLGYRMALSPREHQVLRVIYLRAPELVSRSELLATCFPEGSQRAENLTVQVNRINHKAREIGGLPLIESVYGKGYILREGIVKRE